MNKVLLVVISLFTINALAQPAIQYTTNIPSPGFSAPVSTAMPTAGIGKSGANETWDFSSLSFTPVGTMNVIMPSSSPLGGSFPTANYAYSFAGTYSFFKISVGEMEVQAFSITKAGSGNDFSPNPRTLLKFPFNFSQIDTDTWQKVGGSTNNVILTYDGYGTLITPSKTYTNIVRIKEDYGNGAIDYQWYAINPLISILVFDHNTNSLYYTGASVSGVSEQNNSNSSVDIYPNPFTTTTTLKIISEAALKNTKLIIYDALGKEIKSMTVHTSEVSITRDGLGNGIYVYKLINNGDIVASGKLIIQ